MAQHLPFHVVAWTVSSVFFLTPSIYINNPTQHVSRLPPPVLLLFPQNNRNLIMTANFYEYRYFEVSDKYDFNSVFFIFSHADEYSLVLAVNSLQQIDFSSLETISNGGIIVFNNFDLCYTGNFSTYLDNPSEQQQCIGSPRRDEQTCSEYLASI